MCCWLFVSAGRSGCATGDPCCCVCAPFLCVFSLEADCLRFSNKLIDGEGWAAAMELLLVAQTVKLLGW